MIKFHRSAAIFAVCFVFLSGIVCCCGNETDKETDSVLASVNGEPVSLSDVMFETQNEEYYLVNALDKKQSAKAIYELRKKTLEEIIDRKLILAEYRKNPFPIDNQQISNALDEMAVKANCRTRSEFYEKLRNSGLSVDEFKRKVEERITVQYVIGRELYVNVNVSPKKVYEYYTAHESDFVTPDKIQLNILFLDCRKADFEAKKVNVKSRINANPSDFLSLVREYSELPGAKKGNYVLLSPVNKLRKEFQEALKEKKLNHIIGPLEIADEGVYYLMADRIIPGNKKALAEVQQDIINKLENEQRINAYNAYVRKLRSQAIIRYMF